MRIIWRYALVAIVILIVVVSLFNIPPRNERLKQGHGHSLARKDGPKNFLASNEWTRNSWDSNAGISISGNGRTCSMTKCFDFSLCHNRPFKVYVYPDSSDERGRKRSVVFGKILDAIRGSRFFTTNPDEACIFVPSLDTIDRDPLSKDYVAAAGELMTRLPYWNEGRNHILFNLFSGTWPDYHETLGFDTARAIVVKASLHERNFRTGFDISLPLFLKDHPVRGGQATKFESKGALYPVHRKYLLTFKGKRYLSGIGSEVRNAVHHLHNGEDIIMLTTCKHGKNWEKMADNRCRTDNNLYNTYDYKDLLENSTFCLVPRGRRLGSFRFVETMIAACIPVSMSNGYVLPFNEVIDWNRAALDLDEKSLFELPGILRFMATESIVQMRQQVHFLYDTYLSSIEKIISTTLEILHDRVNPQSRRSYIMWNHAPGGLLSLPSFSQHLHNYPFYSSVLRTSPNDTFTAIISAHTPVKNSGAPIVRLIRQLSLTPSLAKVIILWTGGSQPPRAKRWPKIPQPIEIVRVKDGQQNGLSRFINPQYVATDAILSLEEDSRMNVDEVAFGFRIWLDFPDRIVGYLARSHYWDTSTGKWRYNPVLSNEYSMILLNGAFYHKYYQHLVHEYLPESVKGVIRVTPTCSDIALNFLVSYVTKHPPIKVAQKAAIRNHHALPFNQNVLLTNANSTYFDDQVMPESPKSLVFAQRERCLQSFTTMFGKMPLAYSQMRFDPLLYKDNVAYSRKRYHRVGLP